MAVYHYTFFVWWVVTTFLSGIFVNILQFCVLPLFWLHRKSYHYLINKLSYLIYAHFTFLAEWWGDFRVHLYTRTPQVLKELEKKNCLVVVNHRNMDWLGAWVFTEHINCTAHTRILMKYIFKFIPVFGFNIWFSEYGFLARNWSKDKTTLQQFIDGCKGATSPFIIALCPEGTRLSKEKIEVGQDYARANGLPVLRHHLVPRTKGFTAISCSLKEHINVVYDFEFAFPDAERTTLSTLINGGTVDGHLFIRQIPISDFKCNDEEEASAFLMKLFQEKDDCMEYFEQNQKFDAPLVPVPRKYKNLCTFIISSIFSASVIVYVASACLQAYSKEAIVLMTCIISSAVILTVSLSMWLTSPAKTSSFGLRKKQN